MNPILFWVMAYLTAGVGLLFLFWLHDKLRFDDEKFRSEYASAELLVGMVLLWPYALWLVFEYFVLEAGE